jgi:hypothetical protein
MGTTTTCVDRRQHHLRESFSAEFISTFEETKYMAQDAQVVNSVQNVPE